MTKKILAAIACLPVLFLAAQVLAQKPVYTPDGGDIRVEYQGASRKVPIGCVQVKAVLEHQGKLYVACGTDGAIVMSLADPANPKFEGRLDTGGGECVGFFIAQDRVWAQTVSLTAKPLEQAMPLPSTSGSIPPVAVPIPPPSALPNTMQTQRPIYLPPPQPTQILRQRTVVKSEKGLADIQPSDDLVVGGHVELTDASDQPLGIATVVAVGKDVATIELPTDVRVAPGNKAYDTSRVPRVSISPPRIGDMAILGGEYRLFLPLSGGLGIGMHFFLDAVYRASFPLAIRATLAPLGMGFTSQKKGTSGETELASTLAVNAYALVTLDTQLFEVGLGAGGQSVNNQTAPPRAWQAFSVAQFLRVGSFDGLNFMLTVQEYANSDTQRFDWAQTDGKFTIPLTYRWWMFLRGGGGQAGYGYGDVGVRYLLKGNGDHGSLFLSGAIGAGVLFFSSGAGVQAGPGVSVGIETRL